MLANSSEQQEKSSYSIHNIPVKSGDYFRAPYDLKTSWFGGIREVERPRWWLFGQQMDMIELGVIRAAVDDALDEIADVIEDNAE